MSSCSSEVDVVRTRITTCDDDNGILYAYQSKPGYANVNQQNVQADTSNEEHQKTIVDILSHCQVIQDAIQNLDKKFNIIHKKVSKIYRFRTKLIWQNRKPLGYAYKHYTYLLSRKVKLQKKKKDVSPPASLSYTGSYSPTTPVRRPSYDSQSNIAGTYGSSQDSVMRDYNIEETRLSQSPKFPPVYTQEDPPYYASNEPVQRSPCMSSFGNQGPHSSTSVPGAMLEQGKSSLAYNPEMMAYPALLERDCLGHDTSSSCIPGIARSSIGTDSCVLKEDFPDDPSIWTVEQVVLFLQHLDPELFAPLANTFRQHDIDGSALLLLPNDIMIKYMGIKLGTALKLSHYIEKLKAQKGIEF
ncbi:Sex comb on midleg-like protein 1 [Myotis brandtii]|uniref:Sex comb on midleg-like protein 1 n=1 Tax=Myotis brandtii TaxID=109478 RepID=S7PT96_MYOBR|nr:PREDICTED: sex comb on midleg-like protein 1 isoform X2 [Myotis brandtii]EPQ14158.1 Sex comb on midleg-like protein 1 [Myotis brandtii]